MRLRLGAALHEWRRKPIGTRRFAALPGPPPWVPPAEPRSAGSYWPARDGVFLFGSWTAPARMRDGSPDWSVDPVHHVRWPRRRTTRRIDLRGAGRAGDVKYVWEPARFGHAFELSRGGPAERERLAREVASWIEQNPWMLGVHWDNGLEAALRALAWTYSDGVLAAAGEPAWRALRPALVSALHHHGLFIERQLDRGGYNHLVADATGLLVLGASYPGLPRARVWADLGERLLREEVGRQIRADGSHVESA
ncbi:MAG TPA: heparinase II/III family protein, partial [Candidatus Polarisedimenticolaceae bacterium]|nr:heparinase II/III family protein [Candidatus Polarisedimenticolaceae bacterium]